MVKKSNSVMATDLIPGTNHYINYEPEEPKPPDNFIDNTVKRGRLLPDGSIEWYGTQEAFPEGWDQTNNNIVKRPDWTPKQEGEDKVRAKESPSHEELLALCEKHGYKINCIAKELKCSWSLVRKWLLEAKLIDPPTNPTVNPEFDAAFTQPPAGEPDPGQQQPTNPAQLTVKPDFEAEIARLDEEFDAAIEKQLARQEQPEQPREITVTDVLMAELDQRQSQYNPSDNDFTCEDNTPIPFRPVSVKPPADLACIKLILIETVIGEGPCQGLSPDIILDLVGQIKDLGVGA